MRKNEIKARVVTNPDRIKYYVTLEKATLVVVSISGIVYNIGLVAGPWFEGQLVQRLFDIMTGRKVFSDMVSFALIYVAVIVFVQFTRFIKRLSVRNSILFIIFIKSKGLGGLMLIVIPLLMAFTMVVQKRMLRAQVDHRIAVGKANNHIPETIQTIRMIHTFRVEDYMKKKYAKYIEDGYKAVDRTNFYDAVYSPIIITMSAILVSVMMIFSAMGAGMQTFFGMSVGTAVAIISYVSKVFGPLESIGMEIQNIQSAISGIYRINEFLCEPERQSTTVEPVFCYDKPAIAFEQVRFGYTKEEEIFHEVSFEVKDKENVTLTGRTGVGKSTAFKLILGMYEAWSGAVSIYGVSVKDLSDDIRARMIGYVEQSFCMIPGTIRDQITMKDESITDWQVFHALELVGLKHRIDELPSGIDTICSEALFSQGQIQLLSIARAIVHNPSILLLDEITANLDSITEKEVLHALKLASSNRTVLSISHRAFERMEQEENMSKRRRSSSSCANFRKSWDYRSRR